MESPRYPLHFRRNPGHNRPPNGTQDVFEAGKGDVIFAPQAHYHYFENASATEELVALIVFNSDAAEPKDDIGIGQSLTAIPNVVLSAVLNVPVSVFEQDSHCRRPNRHCEAPRRPDGGPDRQDRDRAVCRRGFHCIKVIGSSRF
jgi:hypothetical protein